MAAPSRAGIPISVKLILTTSVVVAIAVGAATWFGQRTMDEVTAQMIKSQRFAGERSITRESEQIVRSVANAVAQPLASSMYPDIKPVLDAAIAEDHVSGADRLQWLVVTDATGQIVQQTKGAPSAQRLADLEKQLAGKEQIKDGANFVYGAPIKFGDSVVGGLRLGVSTSGLEAELAKSIALARDSARSSRDRLLLVALGVLGLGILLAAFQGLSVARPIRMLTVQANKIAGGDLQSRVPEDRRDELGVLARTFNYMSDAMVKLLASQAEKASLEKEMELARQVQQAMLPPQQLDAHGSFRVVGSCMPASQCGGDWWMYRKLTNGRMLLVVGDATGHGIHSAMIAATARGAVEALAAVDERLLTPEQVLRAIDQAIRMVGEHNVLMTAFASVFDSQTGMLHYANAGQNFPYVIKRNDQRVLADASIIAASGNPLGDRNIAVEIRRGSLQLTPGDVFVCFTDGVVERANKQGKLFGDRRLRAALAGLPVPDAGSLVTVRDTVLAAVERHAEGEMAQDDITFVLCQFDPQPAARRAVG